VIFFIYSSPEIDYMVDDKAGRIFITLYTIL